MTIDRAGYPFIGGTAALAIAAALTVGYAGAVPLIVLAAFFTFFFRDPDRQSPPDPRLVLSPADGRVLVAGPADPSASPPGEWKQISIFLSPTDVHVNRSPVSGTGDARRFPPREDTCRRTIATPPPRTSAARSGSTINGFTVVFRQIVGILARRVVCRVAPGAQLRGGSAVRHHEIRVAHGRVRPALGRAEGRVGDKVVGGVTVIAELEGESENLKSKIWNLKRAVHTIARIAVRGDFRTLTF